LTDQKAIDHPHRKALSLSIQPASLETSFVFDERRESALEVSSGHCGVRFFDQSQLITRRREVVGWAGLRGLLRPVTRSNVSCDLRWPIRHQVPRRGCLTEPEGDKAAARAADADQAQHHPPKHPRPSAEPITMNIVVGDSALR
jgi:hypothetical protein